MVQRLDGNLTIGGAHSYDEPFDFDVDEAPYDHLRGAPGGRGMTCSPAIAEATFAA